MIAVPPGEVADRLTILCLKASHGVDVKGELERYEREARLLRIKPEMIEKLHEVNHSIWKLEYDIRLGKEGKLGLEEVGRRALKIRDFNKVRIELKNRISRSFPDSYMETKVDHASC